MGQYIQLYKQPFNTNTDGNKIYVYVECIKHNIAVLFIMTGHCVVRSVNECSTDDGKDV